MKQLLGLIALVSALGLQSCNEEIDLAGEFKETAVVYGILDQADSVHMIKITRAFIGPGNSLEIAQIPDSNLFQNVVATITEIGGENRSWTLNDTIVPNKDPNGVFYAPDQKLYYFTTPSTGNPLDPQAKYQLNINVNNGEFEVNGETELVRGLSIINDPSAAGFKFSENPGEYKIPTVAGQVGSPFNIAVMNATAEIDYYDHIGTSHTKQTVKWELGEVPVNVGQGEKKTFTLNGLTFYNLLKSSCENGDPAVDKRTMGEIRVVLTAGSEDLNSYILVNQPSSSLAQSKPTFTNLTATNGHPVVGIFTSRFTVTKTYPFYILGQEWIRNINKNSTRELCTGPITGPYLFCSNHPADIASSESYICQ